MFIYSVITTVIFCTLTIISISGSFDIDAFLFLGLLTLFPVVLYGLPIAIMITLLTKRIILKNNFMKLVLETILYISCSILGTYFTLYFISEGNITETGFFNKESLIYIFYGSYCAVVFQISMHVYTKRIKKN